MCTFSPFFLPLPNVYITLTAVSTASYKIHNSAGYPPITFAFLTCQSEQVAKMSADRKTGLFCKEDKLFYFRNELNLSDKLMENSYKNSTETFSSCQIQTAVPCSHGCFDTTILLNVSKKLTLKILELRIDIIHSILRA
jgi:hypothetical protein